MADSSLTKADILDKLDQYRDFSFYELDLDVEEEEFDEATEETCEIAVYELS